VDERKSRIERALDEARRTSKAVRIDGNSKCSLYAWPDGVLRDGIGREWPLEDALYLLENLELYRDQDT